MTGENENQVLVDGGTSVSYTIAAAGGVTFPEACIGTLTWTIIPSSASFINLILLTRVRLDTTDAPPTYLIIEDLTSEIPAGLYDFTL